MKKVLLGITALLAAGIFAGPALGATTTSPTVLTPVFDTFTFGGAGVKPMEVVAVNDIVVIQPTTPKNIASDVGTRRVLAALTAKVAKTMEVVAVNDAVIARKDAAAAGVPTAIPVLNAATHYAEVADTHKVSVGTAKIALTANIAAV